MHTFEQILNKYNNLAVCIKFILLWIALSDDKFTEDEYKYINHVFPPDSENSNTEELIHVLKRNDITDMLLVSDILRREVNSDQKIPLLELAIGVAVADGRLSISENMILRYLSDLIGLSEYTLENIYLESVGKELPKINDLSSAQFWEKHSGQSKYSEDNSTSNKSKSNYTNNEHIASLAILGLTAGATRDEIKSAYRRLAKIHHPDKFHSLGADAVAAANSTMQRIQNAYNYLMAL